MRKDLKKEVEDSEKIKSLTWMYFLKQKAKEIGIALIAIPSFIFIPYYIGLFINNYVKLQIDGIQDYWICGLITMGMLVAVCYGIFYFIRSNWRKARDRAILEVGRKDD